MPTSFIHEVADLGYLERHGMAGDALQRMAALHTGVTEVGAVAERAEVREPILNYCLPAGPDAISPAAWERRAGHGFSGKNHRGPRRPAADARCLQA